MDRTRSTVVEKERSIDEGGVRLLARPHGYDDLSRQPLALPEDAEWRGHDDGTRTGRVLAWVGGNHHRYLPFDLVQAHRPIASTIKPVLYAAALEQGMEPCTYLANKDSIYADLDDWHPRNFRTVSRCTHVT
jgi:hypothetical protein